jgi:hydrogenase expression/formation protein HypE
VSERDARIALRHGAGGPATRALVAALVAGARDADGPDLVALGALDDGAAIRLGERWLVFTADAHVVKPPFFPGGDIGRLAVAGTVNDLAMMGATEVLGLSCAIVLEEGFPREALARIQASIDATSREAAAPVVTGDTKVMGRGELDGVVLSTSGVALTSRLVRDNGLRPGDEIVVTGTIGDHGFAVLGERHALGLGDAIRSDVAPLGGLVRTALDAAGDAIVAMKDPTRGGVASALHEMAGKSGVGVVLDEAALPVVDAVRAASELLGIDPLHVANEGKALLGVRPEALDALLAALASHPLGKDARRIGRCFAGHVGSVVLDTGFGRRLVTESDGELLPRIC